MVKLPLLKGGHSLCLLDLGHARAPRTLGRVKPRIEILLIMSSILLGEDIEVY